MCLSIYPYISLYSHGLTIFHTQPTGLHRTQEALRLRSDAERHPQLRGTHTRPERAAIHVDAHSQRRGCGAGDPDAPESGGRQRVCPAL